MEGLLGNERKMRSRKVGDFIVDSDGGTLRTCILRGIIRQQKYRGF